jgi:hypothetical protein
LRDDRVGEGILEGLTAVLVLSDPNDEQLLEDRLFIAWVSIALGDAGRRFAAGRQRATVNRNSVRS